MQIVVDAHVHIHDNFPLHAVFDTAVVNFKKAVTQGRDIEESATFVLLLTESANRRWYEILVEHANVCRSIGNTGQRWSVSRCPEEGALFLQRQDGAALSVLSGRQIVTAENLEVLALMTPACFEENKPLSKVVQEVWKEGGIPVVPWGFGKWMGRRGRFLRDFLENNPGQIWLGDNRGRPVFWPRPNLFSIVEKQGGRVLPGSDPLPFSSEVRNIANFGFVMEGRFDPHHPLESLKKNLFDPATIVRPYGRLEHPLRFVRSQVAMQIRKHIHF